MKILGLDPGSRLLGYGVIEPAGSKWRRLESGVLRLDPKRPMSERLGQAYREIAALIDRHAPEWVAIEECFVAHSPRAALVLGQVRGVLILAADQASVRLAEYAPRAVKLAAVGNGAAAKEQIQFMLPRLLDACASDLRPDEADALAVAWCCATHANAPGAAGSADDRPPGPRRRSGRTGSGNAVAGSVRGAGTASGVARDAKTSSGSVRGAGTATGVVRGAKTSSATVRRADPASHAACGAKASGVARGENTGSGEPRRANSESGGSQTRARRPRSGESR